MVIVTRHPRFFLDDGNIVLQVEDTLFKVHRFFLVQHSLVIRDMLDLPHQDGHTEGTEYNPIHLPGDSSNDWAVIFSYLYPAHPFGPSDYSGDEILSILRIGHKYCMDVIEQDAIKILRHTTTTGDLFYLLTASSIVGSSKLRQEALNGLVEALPNLTLEQAQSLDFDAILSIYTRNRTSYFEVDRKLAPYPMPSSPDDDDDDTFTKLGISRCWQHHVVAALLGGAFVYLFTI